MFNLKYNCQNCMIMSMIIMSMSKLATSCYMENLWTGSSTAKAWYFIGRGTVRYRENT